MELQIQDLVSSIRKDGIEAANAEAEAIISEAKKKAETIVADAKAEAKSVQEASEKEIGILKESAAISAEQAKRDAMLAFKTEVQAEFEKILSAKIENNLSDAALGKLIHALSAGSRELRSMHSQNLFRLCPSRSVYGNHR